MIYLDGAEYPENESLTNSQSSGTNAKGKVNANILSNLVILTILCVGFGPFLQPNGAA